jgi:NDP-sugar pyrophosphorylase family protein
MGYTIFIPTAGVGSRLSGLTKQINKSLVNIANKPSISHIIEKFPTDCTFIVALGYKGELVREYLQLTYPDLTILFVEVTPYIGTGSGLGHSILSCKEYLCQPFIFCSCDTLVEDSIPSPSHDWIGYSDVSASEKYRTISLTNSFVDSIYEKGLSQSLERPVYPYIGLAGIFDYSSFWYSFEHNDNFLEEGEVCGLSGLVSQSRVTGYKFEWHDTGSLDGVAEARKYYTNEFQPHILPKPNEEIWFANNKVIKFSTDSLFIKNRVQRASKLNGFVPQVLDSQCYMYSYDLVQGSTLTDTVTLPTFRKLLNHARDFWQVHDLTPERRSIFTEKCLQFYFTKTCQRVDLFRRNFSLLDGQEDINDEQMPTLASLLDDVPWDQIANGIPGRFHGDFHFENIIVTNSSEFIFLDWRQDFMGDIEVGDIYYDLAKLLHGIIVSHPVIVKGLYSVTWTDHSITYDFYRKQVLTECEYLLQEWCISHAFSWKRVRILTSLIFLNIAPLHHHPYSLFLYALGKRMLSHELVTDE